MIRDHPPMNAPMLDEDLGPGASIYIADESGYTPLMNAVADDDLEAIDSLLAAGAPVDALRMDETALSLTTSNAAAMRLLQAGADVYQLTPEMRRSLLGLVPDPDEDLLDVSTEQFNAGRTRRFGNTNPELFEVPFWEAMIRAGVNSWCAGNRYDGPEKRREGAVWCAERFGQSITFLPDGRIVQIAGEHEDFYDPDFCIYNDVFVHHPDGTFKIYGYPEAVFPPTDFHTATLLGDYIYIIGSLGYSRSRQRGTTPVYRLNIHSLQIEKVTTTGTAPGWIHKHRAVAASPNEIHVTGGKIAAWDGDEEQLVENTQTFVLRVDQNAWTNIETRQ